MDPLAHTLAGATLAESGLKRLSPLSLPTLLIAANIPDVDVIWQFVSHDQGLLHRRGMTHGVLALCIWPFVLVALALVWDKFVRRRRDPTLAPVRPLALLVVAAIGVVSHPLLDWLNTYGVRLLMPFSGQWFYGDMLFIIDPWVWLLMAAGVVLVHSRSLLGRMGWAALGALTSFLILSQDLVPVVAKWVWLVGIAVIILLRWRSADSEDSTKGRRVAGGCLAVFFLYLGGVSLGNEASRGLATKFHDGDVVQRVMTGPVPADPLMREVIVATETHYHGYRISLWNGTPELLFAPQPIAPSNEWVAAAARRKDSIQGFVNWMRFPLYEISELEEGWSVTIRDLRYVRPEDQEGRGIGMARVFVARAEVDPDGSL